MGTRYDGLVERLRAASRPERPVPAPAEGYLELVRTGAYRITDADVAELRRLGLDEDEIFELTVAAAVGAGLERLDAGLRTLA